MTYEEREKERQAILEKKARGEKLTQEESRLANMNMIKPGEVRNPKGRGKGNLSWSTRIRRLMEDEKLLQSVIQTLPKEWNNIVEGTPSDVIAASMIASVVRKAAQSVAEGKSLDDQTLKTIDRISKIGYGDKVVVDTENGFLEKAQVVFNIVPDREGKPKD